MSIEEISMIMLLLIYTIYYMIMKSYYSNENILFREIMKYVLTYEEMK